MKVSFIPRYGREAASSRLRVFAIADAINAHGLGEAVTEYSADADVLVVQKAVDPKIFDLASKHKGLVVYDLDDWIDYGIVAQALLTSDLITVDTAGRAAELRAGTQMNVAVIPDVLDYESHGPAGPAELDDYRSAVWFGNYPNFESARWMVRELQRRGPLGAISDLSEQTADMGPQFSLKPWALDTFPDELRRWGMALLSHKGADPNKSSNKMAAAYHLGVPCIVSGSQEYKDLAEACGLGWTYVKDRGGLLSAHERLSDYTERARAVIKAQPVIWDRYNAKSVAQYALKVWANA